VDLRNLNVVVVGLGQSGIDACMLLHKNAAIVSATDGGKGPVLDKAAAVLREKFIEVELGAHTEEFLSRADAMILSPGVPQDSLPVKFAERMSIPTLSEIEQGYYYCPGPILAVTGTNGKSTVVTLMGDIMKKAGRKFNVCGNIGNSLCGEILNGRIDDKTAVVLEVSSFQLERIAEFKPAVSCILNITEDHLERYADFKGYTEAKLRIAMNQDPKSFIVLNYDDPSLRDIEHKIPATILYYSMKEPVDNGVFFENGRFIMTRKGLARDPIAMPESDLKGSHNIENVMACLLMAEAMNVKIEAVMDAVKEYKLLHHRIEKVDEVNGVIYIDDSKGTNIDATKRALEAMDRKVVLIAGGRDKGGDYSVIKDEVLKKVKKIVLIGEAAPIIRKVFDGIVAVEDADTMENAVLKSFHAAVNGDAVLLSPMCSSFDMFRDYKHRGDAFREAVIKIKTGKTAK